MITKRQEMILKLIVKSFVKNGLPISSNWLLETENLQMSSATIRNEMKILEEKVFIQKPYNQGGRIPTNKGYEYYVDYLMDTKIGFAEKIHNLFATRKNSINSTLQQASKIISELTNSATVIISPDTSEDILTAINVTDCANNKVNTIIVTSSGQSYGRTYAFNNQKEVKEFHLLIKILQDRLISTPIKLLVQTFTNLKPIIAKEIKNLEISFQSFIIELLSLKQDLFFQSGSFNLVRYKNITPEAKAKLIKLIENHSSFKQFLKNQKRSISINEDGSAIIQKQYQIQGQKGSIAVIGSSQMEYEKINKVILQVISEIEKTF